MNEADIAALQPDDELLIGLGSDIWLMDDHRWALYVWERFGIERDISGFSLVHADYHWDGVNDFHAYNKEREALQSADLSQLYKLVHEGNWIRYDSFIAPAVIRGLVREVHFLCKQTNVEDHGLDEDLLASSGARQYLHNDVDSLAAVKFTKPVIFDLCLDLFNRSEQVAEGDLWSDAEIEATLNRLRPII